MRYRMYSQAHSVYLLWERVMLQYKRASQSYVHYSKSIIDLGAIDPLKSEFTINYIVEYKIINIQYFVVCTRQSMVPFKEHPL